MKNQKGFVKILMMIVIIIAIAILVYVKINLRTNKISINDSIIIDDFLISATNNSSNFSTKSNTPASEDETVDWKAYRNDNYGFKVKYPGGWKMQEYKIKNSNDVVSVSLDPLKTISQSILETIDVPAGLVTIELGGNNSYVIGYDDFETIKIGQNVIAKKYDETTRDTEDTEWGNKHSITYYVGDKIKIHYVSDLNDRYLKTFNKILSTFEIIK